jgi:hypothetical protein
MEHSPFNPKSIWIVVLVMETNANWYEMTVLCPGSAACQKVGHLISHTLYQMKGMFSKLEVQIKQVEKTVSVYLLEEPALSISLV